jgi:large subunit ribosomal protein L23
MLLDVYQIIKKPHITERSNVLKSRDNKYVFVVDIRANKSEVKKAVEELFKVSVTKVNTLIMHGKKRRMGKHEGMRSDWKKAIVTLKKGESIKELEQA